MAHWRCFEPPSLWGFPNSSHWKLTAKAGGRVLWPTVSQAWGHPREKAEETEPPLSTSPQCPVGAAVGRARCEAQGARAGRCRSALGRSAGGGGRAGPQADSRAGAAGRPGAAPGWLTMGLREGRQKEQDACLAARNETHPAQSRTPGRQTHIWGAEGRNPPRAPWDVGPPTAWQAPSGSLPGCPPQCRPRPALPARASLATPFKDEFLLAGETPRSQAPPRLAGTPGSALAS